ncbi:MAG: DUF2017 domain-containing protein [Candidatus Nanopelagicales bacterium]|nr:DUF2017 domain-containing protein [Candidatus Nanopelagicales bacterium]
MPGGFTASSQGRIVLRVDEVERVLLLSLCAQVIELVAPEPADPDADPLAVAVGIAPTAARPEDAVLLRLFPDAYSDDDAAAGDFRRFTERDLRATKLAHAEAVRDSLERSGGKVVFAAALAPSWLGLLNDVRLALGVRIGIDDDFNDEVGDLDEDDPRMAMVGVYDWLTYLQDSLVQLMLP